LGSEPHSVIDFVLRAAAASPSQPGRVRRPSRRADPDEPLLVEDWYRKVRPVVLTSSGELSCGTSSPPRPWMPCGHGRRGESISGARRLAPTTGGREGREAGCLCALMRARSGRRWLRGRGADLQLQDWQAGPAV